MTTNFRINGTDTDDLFVRKDLFTEGGIWASGSNASGQLGEGTINTFRSSPFQVVGGGTNWKEVSCGYNHTISIKTDGSLWIWGDNSFGQLGLDDRTHRSSPIQTVSGGTNWKEISGGSSHTAAIKTDATLWLWGRNTYGQLGVNDIVHRSSPVQIISGGTNWKQVSCGSQHTVAIKTDGTLWLWGSNDIGQLGTNDIVHRSSPVQTVSGGTNWKQVSCGSQHTAAIKTDGTLWLWGYGQSGALGVGFNHRSSPVQTVSGGTNWKQINCGGNFTAAIKTDGTLWLWGDNGNGQLGDNSITFKSSPVQTVSGGTNWKLVRCGFYHTAAIKTDGTIWTWGSGTSGQLGNLGIIDRYIPLQSTFYRGWKLNCGSGHTASISENFWV